MLNNAASNSAPNSAKRKPVVILSLLVIGVSMLACMLLVASNVVTPWPSTVHVKASVEEHMLLGSSAMASPLHAGAEFRRCRGPGPEEVVPRLLSVRQWRDGSRARRRESVALVTQLPVERLDMLANQCGVWPDALAAVVFVPTVQDRIVSNSDLGGKPVADAAARLQEFHDRMQERGACILDLELATQDFPTVEDSRLHPSNAARNVALRLAQAEALLLLDVDAVPSPTWVAGYNTTEGYAKLMSILNRQQALVVPAFEITKNVTRVKQLALAAARGGKKLVVAGRRKGSLSGAQLKSNKEGHDCVNFDRWMKESQPYPIAYCPGFEPSVLVSRWFAPWHDERFRGPGNGKLQHITHLAGLNVTFLVHPTAFVVRIPHSKAAASKNIRLYQRVYEDIQQHQFVPVVAHTELCEMV